MRDGGRRSLIATHWPVLPTAFGVIGATGATVFGVVEGVAWMKADSQQISWMVYVLF